MKTLFEKLYKTIGVGLLLIIPFISTAQPGTVHFTPDFSWRNGQLSHYYQMVSWTDSQYREFAYWTENSSGGATEFMNFRVIFPPNYQPNGSVKYPMIVMLHGAGESGREWTGRFNYSPSDPEYDNNGHQLLHGGQQHRDAVNKPITDPKAFPGIVLFPQASYNGAWSSAWDNGAPSANAAMAAKIIEYLIANHNVDQHRIVTHGLSNGAKGVWDMVTKRPDLFAGVLPMSGVGSDIAPMTDIVVTTPLWQFQGGIDTNPSPGNTNTWINTIKTKGGTPLYTTYPSLGHGVWNTAYAEPNFFPWILQQDVRNIFVFGGSPIVCAGGSVKLGMAAGFLQYQWTRNGVNIAGATTRFYTATQPGTYTVKFQRRTDNVWDESFPKVLTTPGAGDAPVLTNTGSLYLPIQITGSLDNIVNLIAPTGYSQYKWYKNGVLAATTTSNIRLVANGTGSNAAVAGSYTVQVLFPSGCMSPSSNAIVVNFNNPQPTTPAFNILTRTALSSSSISMTWQDVAGETQYEVWRYRRGDYLAGPPATGYSLQKFGVIAFLGPNTTSFTDTGLRPGASYMYRIRAVMADGSGAVASNQPAPTYIITPNETVAPAAPTNLIADDVTDTGLTLSWTASTDNDVVYEYEVYNGAAKLATLRSDTLDADRTDGNPTPATQYVVTGLTPGGSYTFNVRARDYRGNFSPYATLLVGTTDNPEGLAYSYYEFTGTRTDVASFNFSQASVASGTIANFDITPKLRSDQFVFSFDGYIQIDNPGTYRFYTNSDDGSRLYINGGEVVNNDGAHAPRTVSATYNFTTAGKHAIRVIFYEQGGSETLIVRYNAGTTNNYATAVAIPNNKLFLNGDEAALMAAPNARTASTPEEPEVEEDQKEEVKVFPIPFNHNVNIRFKRDAGMQQVVLLDMVGTTMNATTVNSGEKQVTVDYSDVPEGQYLLVVGTSRFRVIKRR